MSDPYAGYVLASYAVFAAVLGWGWLAPRLRIARALRQARHHATRAQAPVPRAPDGELSR